MNLLVEPAAEAVGHERAITSLCDRTGTPLTEVRSLFAQEFSTLELGAKVRSYLSVLTASNVSQCCVGKAHSAQKDGQARPSGAS